MTPHEWFVEHRIDYAAGALDDADARTFQAHVAHCDECRRELARIETELTWLPMGVAPVAPRPGLQRRIVEHVLHGPRRRLGWVAPLAVAASLLLAVGAWLGGRRGSEALEARLAIERARVAALEDTLSVIRRAGRVLYADLESGGARGSLVIFADETTHRWSVVVQGLPPAPAGGRYQFWFICADGMVRGVEVQPSEQRPMMFTTGMPETGGEVMGAALTVEPVGSSGGSPQGTPLAHLML